MIRQFTAPNVNAMLTQVMREFRDDPERILTTTTSRNGLVKVFPGPVALTYTKPWERVCFSPDRDANPFFHFLESMWMLAARDDVEFLNLYNTQMKQFSDNGETFNAAYGARARNHFTFSARNHFTFDQLIAVVRYLKDHPDGRQAVVQLWDPADLVKETKDKACNLEMLFAIRRGKLELTVFNRSNDAILGALGANVVHMSFFQQYVADALGLRCGNYYQISNNFHMYLDGPKTQAMMNDRGDHDLYAKEFLMAENAEHAVMFKPNEWEDFDSEVQEFCGRACGNRSVILPSYNIDFLNNVAVPIHNAFVTRDQVFVDRIDALDWRRACAKWIDRRAKAKS